MGLLGFVKKIKKCRNNIRNDMVGELAFLEKLCHVGDDRRVEGGRSADGSQEDGKAHR